MLRINGWGGIFGRAIAGSAMLLGAAYSQTQVNMYMSHSVNGNAVDFTCGAGQSVRIYVCRPNIVRVSFDTRTTGKFTSARDVLGMADINRAWDPVSYTADDSGTYVLIRTSALKIHVQKSPFRLTYYDSTGALITGEDASRGMAVNASTAANPAVQFTQKADEHYFGWGLTYAWLRDGGSVKIDNKGQTYAKRRSEGYYMYSTAGYGLFLLFAEPRPPQTGIGDIDGGAASAGFDLTGNYAKYWQSPSSQYGFGSMEYLSYFFIAGDWRTAISGYTEASGRPPIIGKKWYGIHRDCYLQTATTNDMRAWCNMFRQLRFPMDVIRMDNFFDWGNLGYLPSPPGNCWDVNVPAQVQYYKTNHFYFGGMVFGIGFHGCCTGCSQDQVDDSAHAQVAVNNGFDFAWYDAMNYHNRMDAQNTWNTWKKTKKGDETRVWVAKGWMSLSSQSWPASHTGDLLHDFGQWWVFPSTLAHHLIGYAVNYTDLGEGFDWNYIGTAMRPVTAFHQAGAAGGTDYNYPECTQLNTFAADLQDLIRKWHRLHYRFIPYFFTYGMIAHETGVPVWRGMMCQNGGEKDPGTYSLNMQCYVGDELIISPYYPDNPVDNMSGARKNIYLPAGVWYDYFAGTRYTGPTTIASYVCDPGGGIINKKLPMFVKARSIIPLMDTMIYVNEKPETLITLQTWPTTGGGDGTEDTSFTMYEDEGVWDTIALTRSPAATTSFGLSCVTSGAVQTTTVNIGAFAGSRYCAGALAARRRYQVELHNVNQVNFVKSDTTNWSAPITAAQYNGRQFGFYWDALTRVCYINATGNAAAGFKVIASTAQTPVRTFFSALARERVSILRQARAVRVAVPFMGAHAVEILNAQGRLMTRRSGNSAASYVISMDRRAPMLYMIRVSIDGRTPVVRKLVF